ncbi:MAG: YdbH domain-containing protein [Sphingomicrobium sp.]
MVSGQSDDGEGKLPFAADNPLRRRRPILFVALLLLGVVLALLAVAWIQRRPIAEHFIEQELQRRGVSATYKVERIGLHNQVIRDVTIGDPNRPDLTADYAKIQMRLQWTGSVQVYRVVARGVRLRGELLNSGKVTWGEIDKLLPAPSGKPFRLPDVAVDVSDAQLSLKTPYGSLGFAVAGIGNLTGGFRGQLAAVGPSLDIGACAVQGLAATVRLAIDVRRPHIIGPVSAGRFACPKSRLAFEQPRLEIDSKFSEGFDKFDGKGRLQVASLLAGTNGLANLVANIDFKGDPKDAEGDFDLAAQRARLASIFADGTRLKGHYRLWPAKGNLALTADYDANSAALAPSVVGQLTGPLDGAAGTPLGPIAKAIAASLRRTAGGFDASGKLVLVNLPGGGGVRVQTADARGPDGARILVNGGDGVSYYWPSGRLRVDGRIATGGGGLPRADIALNQPRGGGPMSGEARIQPYAAGGARLAFAPVTFRAAADGTTSVSTVAVLDGPFSGGRVTGLRIPIDGRIGGPSGGFAFGRGCIDARFTSLTAGSLKLGAARLPLCATNGAIVAKRGSGPVQIGASTRNLRLGGRLGKAPFALTASQARFGQGNRFDATALVARFGNPDAPVRAKAARLSGQLVKGGATGNFSNADVIIGKVPVALEKAAGKWSFLGSALAIDASATAYDLAEQPRFYPLVTDDLVFRLSGDLIRADATLKTPVNGATVTKVSINHRLSNGEGGAVLDVPGIQFARRGLQPEQITRLSEGVIALVDGSVSGQGRIDWRGNGSVTSTGEFTTSNMDLAAAFGPVTGLSTTVRFTDLLGLVTAPGQVLSVNSLNPGIEVVDGQIKYQILPGQLVKIERGEWPFMGGRLVLEETILNFAKSSPKRLTFTVVGLDANTFVSTLQFDDLKATGVFDGALPMIFDDGGGRIVGGRLESRPGGGTLSYEGAINKANLGFFGGLAFDALKSLRFNNMVIRLDGDLAGEFATRLTIDQVALGNDTGTQRLVKRIVRSIPFKFNVTIRGPFRSLIATAKSIRDPRNVIRDVLPVPLDQIPGIVTEVRRKDEEQTQTQTPVDQKIKISTTPPSADPTSKEERP